MLIRSLFLLVILVLSCAVTSLAIECSSANFTIKSPECGYLHHYGIYENLDLLEFSITQPPTQFCFTINNALLDIEAQKCVGVITNTNVQLVLPEDACNGLSLQQWIYDSDQKHLVDLTVSLCMSPWNYPIPPPDVNCVPGLSPCAEWNDIIVQPNPYRLAEEQIGY